MKALHLLFFCVTAVPGIIAAQNRYDIVISEIMCDPSPQVGLPANEWLELKNTSSAPVNLLNWRIADATNQSGPLPNYTLQPDSVVIVCPTSALAAMTNFGPAIAVTSFPSLDNEGDQVVVRASNGKTIHAVAFQSHWYRNDVKKEGGWTLEMIDTKNPCTGGANWKASPHPTGGTPGKINAADALNTDGTAPVLIKAFTTDSQTIWLQFDETLDSLSASNLSNYTIDGNIVLVSAAAIPPLFHSIQLKTNTPLVNHKIYTVTARQVADCKNNSTGLQTTRVGIPGDALPGEWIINEILFNPRANGYDYIEVLNTGTNILDASRLSIANRNSTGSISSARPLSTTPFYIFPGDHIVVTEDAGNLALQYHVKNPGLVLEIAALPSFPDEEGTVILLNAQAEVVDEVSYDDKWHFKLINNAEGVALERIDPLARSQWSDNWHSAASTAGYGTPTYRNSQLRLPFVSNATITCAPKLFSPDNDGRDDIACVQYEVTGHDYVANITIFDAAGRPVRYLVRNGFLGLKGYWNWDGLDDLGHALPVGTYIIFTEIFNLGGRKEVYKTPVVLARKL